MADISETLRKDLRNREFSEGYAESFLDTFVATQVKVLREQRELTQKQLADKLDTSQGVISRIEDAEYGSWNVKTLKKIARVLDVRLHISFETCGSLIGEMKRFGRKSLERVPRNEDPVLFPEIRGKSRFQLAAYQFKLFDTAGSGSSASVIASATGARSMVTKPIRQDAPFGSAKVIDLFRNQRKKLAKAGAEKTLGADSLTPAPGTSKFGVG
jgi:transcriptional regulator with XRE-family HTH domain